MIPTAEEPSRNRIPDCFSGPSVDQKYTNCQLGLKQGLSSVGGNHPLKNSVCTVQQGPEEEQSAREHLEEAANQMWRVQRK
ncbi:peroxisome biogenesis factor 2 isoform X2 [Phyllostomus hastatus]|uniref:peroxisome biogenesis factor 2 isoform X2 n=1 Tax=Phyllostomus hastatus TaxID=9423 RepID=UPI001E682BFA|nr:peroxisome biogenesis factor 2 isoform X2 [Phyllostomus hastatus]